MAANNPAITCARADGLAATVWPSRRDAFWTGEANDGGGLFARPPAPAPSPAGRTEAPGGYSAATAGEGGQELAWPAANGWLPRLERPDVFSGGVQFGAKSRLS